MPTARPSSCEKGREGEDKAAGFLEGKGYEIIARNYRMKGGEIDIIAREGEILVFVEVKSLPGGTAETLAGELGQRKRSRILRTAKYFLLEHPEYSACLIRFDVIALDVPGLESVCHMKAAFSESGIL